MESIKREMNGTPASGADVQEGSSVVARLESAAESGVNGHAK